MWLTIAEIIKQTDFIPADRIIWKKKSALPNNTSSNKLTRIVEDIFVFCRKSEIKTFNSNKKVTSVRVDRPTQKYYENVFNFIEAKNNDGSCNLNKATYSSELCEKLLGIYAKPESVIYDSFIGTGTTAVACKKLGYAYIGSELSDKQCEYANNRLISA
jgi:DNA modification methylase